MHLEVRQECLEPALPMPQLEQSPLGLLQYAPGFRTVRMFLPSTLTCYRRKTIARLPAGHARRSRYVHASTPHLPERPEAAWQILDSALRIICHCPHAGTQLTRRPHQFAT
jgi:hypothetical protein